MANVQCHESNNLLILFYFHAANIFQPKIDIVMSLGDSNNLQQKFSTVLGHRKYDDILMMMMMIFFDYQNTFPD